MATRWTENIHYAIGWLLDSIAAVLGRSVLTPNLSLSLTDGEARGVRRFEDIGANANTIRFRAPNTTISGCQYDGSRNQHG
jgi:hypothetical protein